MTSTIMYPNENMELSSGCDRKFHVLSLHIHANLSIKNQFQVPCCHPASLFDTKHRPDIDRFPIRL